MELKISVNCLILCCNCNLLDAYIYQILKIIYKKYKQRITIMKSVTLNYEVVIKLFCHNLEISMFPFNNYSSRFNVQTDIHACSLYHHLKTMVGLTMGFRRCPYTCISKLGTPTISCIYLKGV